MKLFFDTETTGLTIKGAPDNDPRQPRLVQLGMIVTDDDGNVRHSTGLIIRPDSFNIPVEASNIHGITDDIAHEFGGNRQLAITQFNYFIRSATTIVCHNTAFDKVVMNNELHRATFAPMDESKLFCTMKACTPICAIPNRWGTGLKWPKLEEAYEYLFGEKLAGAHDAVNDVKATARIYFELQRREREVKKEKILDAVFAPLK